MSFETPLPPYNASDPNATFLNTSCLDLLLIELVPMAYRIVNELDSDYPTTSQPPPSSPTNLRKSVEAANTKSGTGEGRKMDEEEERDAVFYRLEMLGYRVGQGLVERFSQSRPLPLTTLDTIKFLCKDLWTLLFRKQIDNLKTNHRGVYVLTDNSFRPFARMSTEVGGNALQRAQPFLWFPCGVIRGALSGLGLESTVVGSSEELPGAVFQVRTVGK